jgi:hypothetical protein
MKPAVVLIVLLSIPAFAISATIYVPDDYPFIQEAIDAALNGDTVIVKPGTYVENIDFMGKSITVKSLYGPERTIIDGNMTTSVVTFNTTEGTDSILQGFTVTNGKGTFVSGWGYCGGGIYCSQASPTLIGNIIAGNDVDYFGGGIYCLNSSPVILNNIIDDNSALSGGGISCWTSFPTIQNNTVCRNHAKNGGGLWCSYFAQPEITNSIFSDNIATTGREFWIGNISIVFISYSDLKGGKSNAFVATGCSLNWGDGMITSIPMFVDPAQGDYHLFYASPCRNTGDSGAVTEMEDFEGDPRIADGFVDMGADEFYHHLYCTGDFSSGGSIEGNLIGLPGTSPVGLFFGSGVLDPPVPTMWGNFHLQAPWHLIPLVPIPGNGVLVLPAAIPSTPPAPYDLPMQALIGLDPDALTNLFVLEVR